MNKKHFMYLNSNRTDSFIHFKNKYPENKDCNIYTDWLFVKNVPLSFKDSYVVVNDDNRTTTLQYETSVLDHLRSRGVIDSSIYDEGVLDKIVNIRRSKKKEDLLQQAKEYHEKYYREIEFTAARVSTVKFTFDLKLYDKWNTIHRMCTKSAGYSVSDSYVKYKNNPCVVSTLHQHENVCRNNCSEPWWFTCRRDKEKFTCGCVDVELPFIEAYTCGFTLKTEMIVPTDYVSSCAISLNLALIFQSHL